MFPKDAARNTATYTILLCFLIFVTCEEPYFSSETNTLQSIEDDSNITEGVTNDTVTVQKCCGEGQVWKNKKCAEGNGAKFEVEVYNSNETHYWLWEDVRINIRPHDPCKYGRIIMEPEISPEDYWIILSNGTLYLRNLTDMVNESEYCLEVLENECKVKAFICVEKEVLASLEHLYRGPLQLISAVCLAVLTYFKHKEKKYPFDSKKCLVMVFGTMTCTYAILAVLSFIGPTCSSNFCKILWILRYYFALVYVIWLALFSIELCRNVMSVTEERNRRSFFEWYLGLAFCMSGILTVMFSTSLERIPLAPLEQSSSVENGMFLYVVYYYAPVGLLCLISTGLVLYLYAISVETKIPNLQQTLHLLTRQNSRIPKGDQKIFYRSCLLLFCIISVCWLLTFVFYLLSRENFQAPQLVLLNITSDLLGVLCIFVFFKKEWLKFKTKNNNNTAEIPLQNRDIHDNNLDINNEKTTNGDVETISADMNTTNEKLLPNT